MIPHFERSAKQISHAARVLGSHRVYGRTPRDALTTFCDRHRWHALTMSPSSMSALTGLIYPTGRPQERYTVQVTPLAVEARTIAVHGGDDYLAYPGDYHVIVLPGGAPARTRDR